MKAHNMEMVILKQSGETVWTSLLDVPERYDLTPILGRQINKFPFFNSYNKRDALVLYNADAMVPNPAATKAFHDFFAERYKSKPASIMRGDVVILTGDPSELDEVHWEL